MPNWAAIVLGIGFAITIVLFLLSSSRRTKRLNEILSSLGLKRKRFLLSKRVADKVEGSKLYWELEGERLFVYLPFQSQLGFTVKPKKHLGAFEEHFGRIQTGQADFDQTFAIVTNNKTFAENFFQRPEIRNLVQDIMNPRVDLLELNGKDLRISISTKTKADPVMMRNHIPNLLRLKTILEAELSPFETLEGRKRTFSIYILYALPICFGIIEIILSIWMSETKRNDFQVLSFSQFLLKAALLFMPIAFGYLFVAYKLTREHPAAYSRFSIAACILSIWFLLSLLFVKASNGFFDKSASRTERYLVVDKYITKGNAHSLILSKKPPNEQSLLDRVQTFTRMAVIKVTVRREEFFNVKPNQTTVELKVRHGVFGIDWIESYRLYYLPRDKGSRSAGEECYSIAYNLYKMGELDSAISEYTKCLEEKGEDAQIYYNRGVAYRKKGSYVEALNDFERAISLKPDMIDAYKNIDWILAQRKDWKKITEWWTIYIQHKPDDPEGYYERAGAYYHMGAVPQAIDDAKKACRLGKKEACEWVKRIG